MNILTIAGHNARSRPQTLRYPDRPRPAKQFRGPVCIDESACLTCGICDYVCVSGAITFTRRRLDCEWRYDPGRCTFCGRCVDHCPGHALRQQEERAPAYLRHGALEAATRIAYPLCPECGRPAMPFNERLLALAYSEVSEITDELRERARLCERCRARRSQAALRTAVGGATGQERSDDGH